MMRRKRIGRLLSGAALAAIFSLFAAQISSQAPPAGEFTPLTYTMVHNRLLSLDLDRTDREQHVSTHMRRGDGSTVAITHFATLGSPPSDVRVITDLQGGRSYITDSSLRSRTTRILSERQIQALRSNPQCEGETESTVLGYDVIRRVRPTNILMHGQEIRSEALVSPELDCLVMEDRTIATNHNDGSERTVSLQRVVHIELGEPADALFVVPADYVEMSPIERLNALGGPDADFSGDALAQQFEQRYQQYQQQ